MNIRIKVNYSKKNRPTSAVINSAIAKAFGEKFGISYEQYQKCEEFNAELQKTVQEFVYKQDGLIDRSDIEFRMMEKILA